MFITSNNNFRTMPRKGLLRKPNPFQMPRAPVNITQRELIGRKSRKSRKLSLVLQTLNRQIPYPGDWGDLDSLPSSTRSSPSSSSPVSPSSFNQEPTSHDCSPIITNTTSPVLISASASWDHSSPCRSSSDSFSSDSSATPFPTRSVRKTLSPLFRTNSSSTPSVPHCSPTKIFATSTVPSSASSSPTHSVVRPPLLRGTSDYFSAESVHETSSESFSSSTFFSDFFESQDSSPKEESTPSKASTAPSLPSPLARTSPVDPSPWNTLQAAARPPPEDIIEEDNGDHPLIDGHVDNEDLLAKNKGELFCLSWEVLKLTGFRNHVDWRHPSRLIQSEEVTTSPAIKAEAEDFAGTLSSQINSLIESRVENMYELQKERRRLDSEPDEILLFYTLFPENTLLPIISLN